MTKNSADTQKPFTEKLTEILNYSALNLVMAVGYQTGLFDVMDTFDTPRTLEAIADKADLNPRYVKEWLGVMVTGQIVELSMGVDEKNRYYLPKQWGDLLARRAGNANLGVYTQEIPLLTSCAMEAVLRDFIAETASPMIIIQNFSHLCPSWPMPNTGRFWLINSCPRLTVAGLSRG